MSPIGAVLDMLASVFGIARKRQELVNTPAQQANAAAKTDQEIKTDARAAIAKANLEKIRRMTAE
jgi:hypothetical protein